MLEGVESLKQFKKKCWINEVTSPLISSRFHLDFCCLDTFERLWRSGGPERKSERHWEDIFKQISDLLNYIFSFYRDYKSRTEVRWDEPWGETCVYTSFLQKTLEKTHSADHLQGNWKLRRQTNCRPRLSWPLLELDGDQYCCFGSGLFSPRETPEMSSNPQSMIHKRQLPAC